MVTNPRPFPIVGIGASAGGLQALDGFFRAMPAQSGMAFVIVMHLAPDRTNFLTEILARHTDMNVVTATDGQLVEENTIYVMPPGAILTIAGRCLQIEETAPGVHERAPIDIFFGSLAEDCGEFAFGIILSGSGSDGVLGVEAIKLNGGLTLAQTSDPSGPGFASMPDSAIATGLVDFAVPVNLMPEKLVGHLHKLDAFQSSARRQSPADEPAVSAARSAIYQILRDQAGQLQSSKEEMQSLNEELQALNEELKVKIDDLDRANSDLKNEFDTTEIATIFLDRNLLIRNFSPAAAQIFSIFPTDRGRPLTDLVAKLDYPELAANLRQVLETGEIIERQTWALEAGGSCFVARLLAYRNTAQQIEGVVAAFFDVTRLTKAEVEVQALQANRTKAMKALAFELAHEIRQPLTAGAAYLSAMRQMLTMSANKRPVSIEDTLEKAAKQLEWAAKIVKHLRDFVPDPDALKTLCYLHNLIRQSVELTGLSVKKAQIWLTLRLDATEDLVFVDPVQIKQVLTNMIRNAIEAMQSSELRKLTISSALIEGRMIQIDVADTGSGISQEVADTMFDANVTTKPEGSGVGLALSRAIIGSHGGTISAPKNKDSGATVSFTLPLAEPK